MTNKKLIDVLYKAITCFLVYSFCGWLYEVILYFKDGYGFVNRGFCFGPWLPVYGVGGLIIIGIFYKYKEKINPILMAIITAAFAAVVELITTYILDFSGIGFHVLWDYDNNFANFQGRIALWPALKFGLLAIGMIYVIQPIMDKHLFSPSEKNCKSNITKAFFLLFFVFLIDAIFHVVFGSNYRG